MQSHFLRLSLGTCAAEGASAANRPQRSIFHRLFAPWLSHGAANPAKTGLAGAGFRYRRLLPRRLLAALLLAGLAACQTPRERVILLPKADGSSSGAVLVKTASGASLTLDQAYAQADATRGQLQASQSNALTVQKEYGALLAMQPPRPRSFVVNFRSNSNELSTETLPIVGLVREALAQLPGGELVVIGHTDRVGTVEANDKLSLVRAETVRELLVRQGIPRERIVVAGRGEREPLVATADEMAEARNRRVEIKLR